MCVSTKALGWDTHEMQMYVLQWACLHALTQSSISTHICSTSTLTHTHTQHYIHTNPRTINTFSAIENVLVCVLLNVVLLGFSTLQWPVMRLPSVFLLPAFTGGGETTVKYWLTLVYTPASSVSYSKSFHHSTSVLLVHWSHSQLDALQRWHFL